LKASIFTVKVAWTTGIKKVRKGYTWFSFIIDHWRADSLTDARDDQCKSAFPCLRDKTDRKGFSFDDGFPLTEDRPSYVEQPNYSLTAYGSPDRG
jgi:hypothetical protein